MPETFEVELKFVCAPEALDMVLAAAPPGADETRELVSIYFDTPRGDLAKAGASLRIRDGGGQRIQTLKRGRGATRREHEMAAPAGLDLRMTALQALLSQEGLYALRPVSRVRIVRRQRLIRYRGAEIELAADLGEVTAGGRSGPICELELELKAGPRRALFGLARTLAKAAPLQLSFESKSARGRALLDQALATVT